MGRCLDRFHTASSIALVLNTTLLCRSAVGPTTLPGRLQHDWIRPWTSKISSNQAISVNPSIIAEVTDASIRPMLISHGNMEADATTATFVQAWSCSLNWTDTRVPKHSRHPSPR